MEKRIRRGLKFAGMLILPFILFAARAQQVFNIDHDHKRATIPFHLVRNMVVVTLNINGKGPFNFILDTGVGIMIITDPSLIDSLNITYRRPIKITGLGSGLDLDAYLVPSLKLQMHGVTAERISAAAFKKDHFGLTNFIGMPIHGLLGYEFFNSFAVRINFMDSTLMVSDVRYMHISKKAGKIPLRIEEHKPYITTSVKMDDQSTASLKLVVDLGAGHSLSLEKLKEAESLTQKCIPASLGVGLSGPISGFISRIDQINLAKYELKNIITAFPDNVGNNLSVDRDGNLGLDILKRFVVVFDYQNNALYLKPNLRFKQPFEHDMSGLEYYADGPDLKHILINRVELGSAGDDVGIKKGDEIVSINFKPVGRMTIEEIDEIFRSRNERSLLLEINHNNQLDKIVLTLKRRI